MQTDDTHFASISGHQAAIFGLDSDSGQTYHSRFVPHHWATTMYSFHTTVSGEFDQVIDKVTEALGKQGFGVLTDIDIQKTMKAKLGIDRLPYRILGACNPGYANRALEVQPDMGLLLPCNVVVREEEDKSVIVAFMDPAAVFTLIDRDDVAPLAEEVRSRLERARESLGGDFIN